MSHTDPRIPGADACVFRNLIDRHAIERPEKVFASFAMDEPDWTYADLRRKVVATANALRDLGVRQGDHVLGWLENGPMIVRTWLAVNYLGAVYVPMNLAYRGGILQHVLALSDARVMVTHSALVERLGDIDPGPVTTVVAVGSPAVSPAKGVEVVPGDILLSHRSEAPPPIDRDIQPWDTQVILLTSGTTGPSKAVLSSYVQHNAVSMNSYPGTTGEDRGLIHSPLFHITAMSKIGWALAAGGSIGVLERFNTGTFWRDARRVGGNFLVMMGSLATFLSKLPREDDEINTPLRLALLAPSNAESEALCRRAGISYYSVFNMTETSTPLITEINPATPSTCGRPRKGMEVRVVDENDCEVPRGTIGELIVRSDTPWTLNSGYYKNPEATAKAWRNGWLHTGDAVREDEDGNFFYMDRVKDSIRRRGENISSFEVEIEIQAHPLVIECAAVAVPSDVGEDDVLVAVVLKAGETLDQAELLDFALKRMPYYMVPRYIRYVTELPKTPTLKVQKVEIRQAGVTADTWDREAAGIRVKREKLSA